jgi:AmiR/NasT family two-component response regulator
MTTKASELAHLSVTLVCEMDGEGEILFRHLQRTRAAVRHVWPAPDRIGDETDIVICEYGPGVSKLLAWMPGEPLAALVLLLPQSGRVDLGELRAACPDSVLQRPYLSQAIDVALMLALDHFGFGKRTRQRIERLEENIHAMRDIERAKRQIMARKQVGEAEAYGILRDMAMQRRVTVAALASKLVDSAGMLI